MVRVRVSTSRVCKASKETLWKVLEDVESWPSWADVNSRIHMLSHKPVKREGNVVVCEEEEIAGGYRIKHVDKYTFYPKDKVVEEIVEGPMSGTWVLNLKEVVEGTRIDWSFDVKAETSRFKIVGLFKGRQVMQGVADEYCRQLAQYAEAEEMASRRKEQVLA